MCLTAVAALGLGLAPPAAAGPAATAVPALSTAPASPPAGALGVADGDGMELSRTVRPVAPGTTLTSFDRLESDKWLRADALSVDLDGGAEVDYLSPGTVSGRATVSELAGAHDPGAGRRTVAAFNADFFDINQTGAPLGPGVDDGEITHSPAPGVTEAVGFGPDGAGRVLDLYFEGTLTLPGGPEPLAAYNAANVPADGIGVYNARWGPADRAQTVDGAAEVTEVTVAGGRVTAVDDAPGDGPVPEGTTVLLGRDAGAKALAALAPGSAVSWEYELRTDGGETPRTAVGGRGVLVVDGEPQNWDGRPNNATAPRTAVGFSRDGSTLHVLTVDGRQAASGGVTLTELALMMDELGAHNALNLDGGGSSTLVAREPGSDTPQVENSPSDGTEREVPNGLAVTAPDGSGALKGFWVETAADPAGAPSADTVPGGHPDRVFPGLTRALTAAGYDETYGPAGGAPRWHSSRPEVGRVDGDGVFHARRTGTAEAVARRGHARGSTTLTVLGPLERIAPTRERVGLPGPGVEASFGFTGFDAEGRSAPVEPSDVALDYDRSLFRIDPDPARGGFTVAAAEGTDSVSGLVRAAVKGEETVLAVTVGLTDRGVAEFDDAGRWTFSAARASGSLAADPAGHDGTGLRMTYDFTQSTATRAAYANPPREIPVPGQPQSFALWLKGDGHGAWPSLHLTDAAGTAQVLRGPHVTWTGWRRIAFEVPQGVAYPLKVRRFYLAETRPAERYRGEVVLDGLTARTPPDVALPAAAPHRDPLISTAADTAGRDWRFAVVSDAQFVAREPDGEPARQARRTLREVRAARPDFVVVNGDWVDEGSPADLAFARRMLEEELGGEVPWYYVPGNHEVMGGSIEGFRAEFGATHRSFDHEGTRFITLDTSSLTLRGGGWDQIRRLRERLEDAAEDDGIGSVVVLAHVPPRDPTPQQGSRLTDRLEADLLEDWLGEFRRRTGKGAAFVGAHAGVFHASRVDGVPYLVNGNAGKAPAAPPGEGGFSGWSLVGIDRGTGRDWISVQTRAHVDGLSLTAPDSVAVGGAPGKVSAVVVQGRGSAARTVPVDRPLSADWSGSRGLCAGDVERARARGHCVAVLDAVAGTLTGLRPGTVTVAVTVSGERQERRVAVVR